MFSGGLFDKQSLGANAMWTGNARHSQMRINGLRIANPFVCVAEPNFEGDPPG